MKLYFLELYFFYWCFIVFSVQSCIYFIRFIHKYLFCESKERKKEGERKGEKEKEKVRVREKGGAIINGIIFFNNHMFTARIQKYN